MSDFKGRRFPTDVSKPIKSSSNMQLTFAPTKGLI
jgi:hypothetical protein